MNHSPFVVAITASLILALRAPAQEEVRPAEPKPTAVGVDLLPQLETTGVLRLELAPMASATREPFVLEAGDHQLGELVDRAAVWLGRNYLRTATDFQQPNLTFSLQVALHLDADGLERVLSHVLYAKGFAVVTLSEELQLYQVIALNGPQRNEVSARARHMAPDEVLQRADRMEQVLTILPLEHINAQVAATATRPFFSQAASSSGALMTGNLGDNRSMLLQGFAPQVAAAIRLIRAADEVAGRAAELERMQSLEQRLQQLEQAEQRAPRGPLPGSAR